MIPTFHLSCEMNLKGMGESDDKKFKIYCNCNHDPTNPMQMFPTEEEKRWDKKNEETQN